MQAQGVALLDLKGAQDGQLYAGKVVRLSLPGRRALPSHALATGESVTVSRGDPADRGACSGIVVDVAATWLRVATTPAMAAKLSGPGLRVDLAANSIAFERACAAIDAFQDMPHNEEPTAGLRRCTSCVMLHVPRHTA